MATATSSQAIDRAIAAAKLREQQRLAAANGGNSSATPVTGSVGGKKHRLTPEERAARKQQYEQERLARKQLKDAKRAERLATKQTGSTSSAKLEKARSLLTQLSPEAQAVYESVINNASLQNIDVTAISQHLSFYVRERATLAALNDKSNQVLKVGTQVRIVGGDPRFVGEVGELTKVARIRGFVKSASFDNPIYVMLSDIVTVEEEQKVLAEAEAAETVTNHDDVEEVGELTHSERVENLITLEESVEEAAQQTE